MWVVGVWGSPRLAAAWAGFAFAASSSWGRAFKFQNWPGVAPGFRCVIDGPIWKFERPTPDQTCAPVRGRLSPGDFFWSAGIAGFCWAASGWSGIGLWVLLCFAISRVALGGCRTESAAWDFCGMFAGRCCRLFRNGVQYVASDGEYG